MIKFRSELCVWLRRRVNLNLIFGRALGQLESKSDDDTLISRRLSDVVDAVCVLQSAWLSKPAEARG